MTTANILDPIHAELDRRVWDKAGSPKPVLKAVHAHWIKAQVYETLEHNGYTDVASWLHLILTGSLTTYQYSEDSDVDISLFVDSKVFPEWSRAEMIALMVHKLDGRTLPGTPFPLQDFVVGQGIKPTDLYKPGLRSGYDLDTNRWIVPPEKDRVHDVKSEQNGFYAWALQMADKMERLLRYEPDEAVSFWHTIHKKRQRDMKAGKGDFAESNVIYKMLANRGLFPAISGASGEYIAKTANAKIAMPYHWHDVDPETQEYMFGQCAAYAGGLHNIKPDLRLGMHWNDKYVDEGDIDDETGDHPQYPMPHHYFAHDDTHAYDAMGRHPLPYEDWDRTTYDHPWDELWHYGMHEGGYEESAEEHARANDVFNKDAPPLPNSKTATTRSLYHGTLLDHKPSIEQSGLIPDVGHFTTDAYGLDEEGGFQPYGDEDNEESDYVSPSEIGVEPVTFMTDKKRMGRALNAMQFNIAHKLGVGFHDVKPQHVQEHGLLVKQPGEMGESEQRPPMRHVFDDNDPVGEPWDEENARSEHPYQAEPGDFYTDNSTGPSGLQFIHGPALMRVLKQHNLWSGNPTSWNHPPEGWQTPPPRGPRPGEQQPLFAKTAAKVLYENFRPDPEHPKGAPGQEPMLPFIYNPESQIVHLGPAGAWHWQVGQRVPDLREHYQGDGEWGQPAYQHAPDHIHGAMSWPSKRLEFMTEPGEHEQAITEALEAKPRDAQWNFSATLSAMPDSLASQIYESTIEGGGTSRNLAGEIPTKRYGFGIRKENEDRFPIAKFTPQDVRSFIESNLQELSQPGKFVGTWVKDGIVYLDVSEEHDDFDTSFQRAWNGHQKSLWDNEINDEIPVRGLDYEPEPVL